MGCPHIQQTARALRSRSHAIFRMYGQRDARPTPVVLLFCVCCIADPAPAAHCPAPVYIHPVLSPSTACRACAPPGCIPSPSFSWRAPPGVFLRGLSAPVVLWYLECYRRALKERRTDGGCDAQTGKNPMAYLIVSAYIILAYFLQWTAIFHPEI